MPRPSKTSEQKAAMRQLIREATSRVVRRHNVAPSDVQGYKQITIRKIIEEAGISIGTFYKYFENRDDLAQSLWSEPIDQLRSRMQSDYDQAANPTDKITTLLEHYVGFAVEHRQIFRAAFLFVRPEGHPARESVELKDEMFYQNLCAAFKEGQKEGMFKPFDVHDMAQLFWAAIHGALALPENLERYNFDQPQKIAENMIAALISLVVTTG